MKIAIMLGRGIEGCGVTKFALQLREHLNVDIFATKDKKWPREKLQNVEATTFVCSNMAEVDRIAKIINSTYDLLLISSVPAKSQDQIVQDNFVELMKKITVRKAIIQHDHKIHSIVRNGRLDDICRNVDVLFTHSLDSDFVRWCNDNNIVKPTFKFEVPFVFESHRKTYWKPIEEQQANVVRWIGRTAMWKGPDLMVDFHNEKLQSSDFITILEGLEASIQYTLVLYKDKDKTQRREVVNFFRPEKQYDPIVKFTKEQYGKEELNKGAYLYPPFEHDACMHRLSKSGFGAELYHLPSKYGQNLEYCHYEVIASGCVPIFHKELGDFAIHSKLGDTLVNCKNSGTLFLDYSNFDQIKEKMIMLKNDSVMRNEYREMAYEFWTSHVSFQSIMQELITSALK